MKNKKQLVRFGKYLLSKERKESFDSVIMPGLTVEERLSSVHDADLKNFREIMRKHKERRKLEKSMR